MVILFSEASEEEIDVAVPNVLKTEVFNQEVIVEVHNQGKFPLTKFSIIGVLFYSMHKLFE